jgi:hypothetical protein
MRVYVQNSVVDIVNAVSFFPVTYDKTTRKAAEGSTAIDSSTISVSVKAVSKTFSSVDANKRSFKYIVSGWRFEVLLKFPVEVTLEEFEEDLCLGIMAGEEQGFTGRLAIFMPISDEEWHPTNDSSSGGGTEAVYILSDVLDKQ